MTAYDLRIAIRCGVATVRELSRWYRHKKIEEIGRHLVGGAAGRNTEGDSGWVIITKTPQAFKI